MNKLLSALSTSIILLVIASCTPEEKSADTIYYGGSIIAMTAPDDVYEAIAVKDGKIMSIGQTKKVLRHSNKETVLVDLNGKTILPGFIDAHSHLMMAIQLTKMVNLSSPPVSDVTSISQLIQKLENYRNGEGIPEGEWIVGWGYDPDLLEEKRHPTKFDLDKAFPNNPVYLSHVSGHLGVLNSAGLQIAGMSAETPDPQGGKIYRVGNSREPNGLLSETAMAAARVLLPVPDSLEVLNMLQTTMELYASNGITTANDGFTNAQQIKTLQYASNEIDFPIDVIGLVGFNEIEAVISDPQFVFEEYENRLKFAGVKIVADGSPQGKTAKMSEPYLTEVPGCVHDCTGITLIDQDQMDQLLQMLYAKDIQVFSHCNGDGAIEMFLAAHEKGLEVTAKESKDLRSVIIHSQFMRPDLIEQYAKYGLIPSYFTNHTFYWGDVHMENMGKERAFFTSPIASSIEAGIQYTNHNDYPITPLDQMAMIKSAATRISRSGKIIGPEERIGVYDALRAQTINAAYQYREEDLKGSLEVGKLADLVIVSDNPLDVDTGQIQDIEILETIKEGIRVYKK